MRKKVLVVSDSHGNYTRLNKIIQKELPLDYLIHCGDGIGDLFHVDLPTGVNVIKASGNMDSGRVHGVEEETIVTIGSIDILVIHGHLQHVKNHYDSLMHKGQKSKVDFVFFGHTHLSEYIENEPGLFNPGSANNGFYGIVFINEKVSFEHRRIE